MVVLGDAVCGQRETAVVRVWEPVIPKQIQPEQHEDDSEQARDGEGSAAAGAHSASSANV